jgi:hypothetical protein
VRAGRAFTLRLPSTVCKNPSLQQGFPNASSWSGARPPQYIASPCKLINQADCQAPSLELWSQPTRSGNHWIQGCIPDVTFKKPVMSGLSLPFVTKNGQSEDGHDIKFLLHWAGCCAIKEIGYPVVAYRWHLFGFQLQTYSHTDFIHSFIHVTNTYRVPADNAAAVSSADKTSMDD